MGELDRAADDFGEAIRLKPTVTGHRFLGRVLADQGRTREAIDQYEEALKLDRRSAVTLNDRGVAYRSLGDLSAAMADWSAAMQLDPLFARPYFNRALARMESDPDGALADIRTYQGLRGPERAGNQVEVDGLIEEIQSRVGGAPEAN
jgi:tetratricopeptide (TPR) repeat protein